jgi:molecular chaperone DnaK
MVGEAERHAQEDRQRREEIEERNRADSLAYQAERTLRDVGEKVSSGLRADVEDKVKAVRDALSANDMPRVRTAANDLERTMQRIGQEVYGQAGAAGSNGTSGSTYDSEPGTVEGEYREV